MTKCMSCVFRKRKMKEYPCNACREVAHDADRSYYVERKEVKRNDK